MSTLVCNGNGVCPSLHRNRAEGTLARRTRGAEPLPGALLGTSLVLAPAQLHCFVESI